MRKPAIILAPAQERAIIQSRATQTALAGKFGVAQSTVSAIRAGNGMLLTIQQGD